MNWYKEQKDAQFLGFLSKKKPQPTVPSPVTRPRPQIQQERDHAVRMMNWYNQGGGKTEPNAKSLYAKWREKFDAILRELEQSTLQMYS